jgi:lipoprotein-anchoring transpeptidase ErfK/SrfK
MADEERYAEDLEAGQRCFRDSLGKYALNIGSSYAIHGTKDPASLGEKRSHGCIRIGIEPMQTLFSLMNKGDMVYIVP